MRLNFRQYDKNQIDVTKYTYDGETSYATVDDAVANNFAATEVSAYEAEYYTDGNTSFAEVATVSSFGTVVKGNGTIKYSFTGSKFALNVRQDEACEIVVKVDGKETRVTLSANSNKTLAFVVEGLTQGEHTVEVTVLQRQHLRRLAVCRVSCNYSFVNCSVCPNFAYALRFWRRVMVWNVGVTTLQNGELGKIC